jgi:beta-lactamase superfamily II metal-dependent hydrolase
VRTIAISLFLFLFVYNPSDARGSEWSIEDFFAEEGTAEKKCIDRLDNSVSIYFVNVGQGNAVVIRNHRNGNVLIIDAGTSARPNDLSDDMLASNIRSLMHLSSARAQSESTEMLSFSLEGGDSLVSDLFEQKRKLEQSSESQFDLDDCSGKIIIIVSHPDKDHINLLAKMILTNQEDIRRRIEHIYLGGNILDYHTGITQAFINALIFIPHTVSVPSAASAEMSSATAEEDVPLNAEMLNKITILSHIVPPGRLAGVLSILAKEPDRDEGRTRSHAGEKINAKKASAHKVVDDGMVSDEDDNEEEKKDKRTRSKEIKRIVDELTKMGIELRSLPFMQHLKIDRFFDPEQERASLEFLAVNAYHSRSHDCQDTPFDICTADVNGGSSINTSERKATKSSIKPDLSTRHLASVRIVDKLSVINDGATGTDSVNGNSAVVRLVINGFNFIFTGDANGTTTDRIMFEEQDFLKLKTRILLANHHGSKSHDTNAASWAFATYPEYVVMSAGLHNGYQHPHFQAVYNYLMLPSVSPPETSMPEGGVPREEAHPIIFQNPVALTGKVVEKMGYGKGTKLFLNMGDAENLLRRFPLLEGDFNAIDGNGVSYSNEEMKTSDAGITYPWIRAMTRARIYTTTCLPSTRNALMFDINYNGDVVGKPIFSS